MGTRLQFDHTFTPDQNHRFLRRLEKLGFTRNQKHAEHPGALCRFIMFRRPGQKRGRYLEFVHNTQRGKPAYKWPGLSLKSPGGLEQLFRRLAKKKALRVGFQHRNYDWKKNEKDRLPGWNFVTFGATPKSCEVWLTEYETAKGRKPSPPVKHKNGAIDVVAVEFDVSVKDRRFFENLLQAKIGNRLMLPCGTAIHFHRAKRTREKSVVISVKDLNFVNRRYGKDLELAAFDGQPALRVRNPVRTAWDLLLVQA